MRPRRRESCCQSPARQHPECMTSSNELGQCLDYTRVTATLSSHSCHFEAREQMNGASGYLDGSDLYGNNDDNMHKLRMYVRGQVDISECELCNRANSSIGHVYLALLREHNRMADELAELNEHWDDSKLFLEARRALMAQIQHVTISEFAPSILGETAFADADLTPTSSGFYSGYSSTNRAGAIDAVALAALQALTSLKRHESSALEEQLVLAARRVSLDVADHEDSQLDWTPAALLVHTARDFGLPGYGQFVDYCSAGRVKVNILILLHRSRK